MAKEVLLTTTAKTHLKDLAEEIVGLLVHAQSSRSGTPPTSWTKNSQDIDVALTVLLAANASINDAVTRFNLVFKANPNEAASESMTREIGGFCQKLISSLSLLSSVGASDSMVGFFSASVRGVLHSLKNLIEALLNPSKHGQLNSLTGMVWKACKDMQQAPNTNKLACRREMMQWSVAIKDTIDEFQEALKASKTTECSADGSEGKQETGGLDEQMVNMHLSGEGLEEDDLDFDDLNEYSQLELQWVDGTIEVLRLFRRCLKAANDALNTVSSTEGTLSGSHESDDEAKLRERRKSELAWAQSLQDCSRRANECAAELGVLMYPPIEGKELSERSEGLRRELVEFCNILNQREEKKGQGNKGESRQSPLAAAVEDRFASLQKILNV